MQHVHCVKESVCNQLCLLYQETSNVFKEVLSQRCDSIPKLPMDLLEAMVLHFCKPETLKSFENRQVKCAINLTCSKTQHCLGNDKFVLVYKHHAKTTKTRTAVRRFLTVALNISEFSTAHPEHFTQGNDRNHNEDIG